jgi:hypothetical protein
VATLPGLRGKVLLSTRLLPRALQGHGGACLIGCHDRELTQMDPADAVQFFHAQGIRGSRAEIERACAPYGYHPLSLRLLAGLILNDLRQPGDVRVAGRLDVSGDLVQRRHHVLGQAYDTLPLSRRRLLSRIACFRGAVGYEAVCAASEGDARGCDVHLRDLLVRGLLHRDRDNRYDLHPIVRRYAYDRLADKAGAHAQLRGYFDAVPKLDKVETLDDLAPGIELYHHTVGARLYDEACDLFYDRLHNPSPFA